MPTLQEVLRGVLFATAALWGIAVITRNVGPWARLAARYPLAQPKPIIAQTRGASMECGLIYYVHMLRMDFAEDSFAVHAPWGHHFFLIPFCVPKTAIHNFRRDMFWGLEWVKFRVDDCQFHILGKTVRTSFFEGLENTV